MFKKESTIWFVKTNLNRTCKIYTINFSVFRKKERGENEMREEKWNSKINELNFIKMWNKSSKCECVSVCVWMCFRTQKQKSQRLRGENWQKKTNSASKLYFYSRESDIKRFSSFQLKFLMNNRFDDVLTQMACDEKQANSNESPDVYCSYITLYMQLLYGSDWLCECVCAHTHTHTHKLYACTHTNWVRDSCLIIFINKI